MRDRKEWDPLNTRLPRLTRLLGAGAFAVALVAALSILASPSASAQTTGDFFVGEMPESGAAMVAVAGGTFDELEAAAKAQSFETVFVTIDGKFVGFPADVPDVVNADFPIGRENG